MFLIWAIKVMDQLALKYIYNFESFILYVIIAAQ